MNDDKFNSATISKMLSLPGSKWHTHPPDVIPLYIADPDFGVADEIKQALIKAVKDEDLFYNFDLPAQEAMAEKIRRRNKINARPEDIRITQGVIPAMWLAVKSTCEKGDEVIINDPMYHHFRTSQEATGSEPKLWNLYFENNYKFDIDQLNELVTPKTKMIFVCNPHNPTGRVMNEEELKGIADIATDNKIYVMVDELWEDIIFDKRKHISLASLNSDIENLCITTWGFSKTFGVAGLKIGYSCITNKELMKSFEKHSTDITRSASNLAKAAAPVMLDSTLDWWREGVMKHLHKIRGICEKRMNEIPKINYKKIEGTYLIFPRFYYDLSCDEMNKYLLEKGKIALDKGTKFGNQEKHQRITIATSESIINETFNRLEKALKNL
jgi:bifunctional pyridoxal-dependent enzyme with beta-cystathionase and maltose regulon repressor activities